MNNKKYLDISSRIPYDNVQVVYAGKLYHAESVNIYHEVELSGLKYTVPIKDVKPVLRSPDSLTAAEEDQLDKLMLYDASPEWILDFYNRHRIDHYGLIKSGEAVDITELDKITK